MDNKIVVSLFGGLGNQLFQYAVGRSLAAKNNSSLVLDLAWFNIVHELKDTTIRKYALHPFQMTTTLQYDGLPFTQKKNRISRLASRFLYNFRQQAVPIFLEKQNFHFDRLLIEEKGPIWLSGYWQSYKYFDPFSDLIRADIGTVGALTDASKKIYLEIISHDAICVHIRRGDYVSNKVAFDTHGLCGADYYDKGLDIVSSKLHDPHCYVFSDDPSWVRLNFNPSFPMTVVDVNGPDEAHQDLWLMQACKCFVIANSSFSWWGAWLSNFGGKVVVAPKKWFASSEFDMPDLIPNDWIMI